MSASNPILDSATRSTHSVIETPFVDVYEGPLDVFPASTANGLARSTPFLSEYSVGDEIVSEASGSFQELLGELYEREFDEALLELLDEADARVQRLENSETPGQERRAELVLRQWIEPLRMEAETLLESMAHGLDSADVEAMSERELDGLLDSFEPEEAGAEPVFEEFLKKLWKKAKKAARGAVKLAKKGIAAVGRILPVGLILRKIKGLVRPLLERVLKLALDRLPASLRPAARQLATRLFGLKEAGEQESMEPDQESPAAADIGALQNEFDAEVASLLLAPTEPDQETLLLESTLEAEHADDGSLTELDRAREEFIAHLTTLEEGEDPAPVIEQFVPAILPVLRMGVSVIGRSKIVKFLAGLLGRLIKPYVGPQLTPPLSQAIVNAGLRMMTLETTEAHSGGDGRILAEAFAGVVEDTVAAVSRLSADELSDEHRLEEAALEGYEAGVRTHFPGSVLKSGPHSAGVWVAMPRRGRKRYRKFSRTFDVTIPEPAAAAIRTRAGRTLQSFLTDRVGMSGPVEARLHLYQAVPGTRLGRIARAERDVSGLGMSTVGSQSEFHPLTSEAAGLLLGRPELGYDVSESYLDELGPVAVGQRFYFLEVPGARPSAPGAKGRRPRLSEASAALDLNAGQLIVAAYLSESQAQALAARLRRREPIGAVLTALRPLLASLRTLASPAGLRRVRIVGQQSDVEPTEEQFLRIPGLKAPRDRIGDLLVRWTRKALASELYRERDAFMAAAAAPEDGVTLRVIVERSPGLAILARLLRGRFDVRALKGLGALFRAPPPGLKLEIVAGHRSA